MGGPASTHGWRPAGRESTRWGGDGGKIQPYGLGVSSKAAAPAGISELDRAQGRERATYLSIRVLAVAAIAFVVTTSLQARPAPGGHGAALGVAVALIAFCGGTIVAMWLTPTRPEVQLAVLLVAVVSAAALIGLQATAQGSSGCSPRSAWPP